MLRQLLESVNHEEMQGTIVVAEKSFAGRVKADRKRVLNNAKPVRTNKESIYECTAPRR